MDLIGGIINLKQNKKHIKKTPKKLPDFSLNDILNAPKPKAPSKHADGLGCTICGNMRYTSKGEIKVFRGERMKVCHCYECGQDFYKSE